MNISMLSHTYKPQKSKPNLTHIVSIIFDFIYESSENKETISIKKIKLPNKLYGISVVWQMMMNCDQ